MAITTYAELQTALSNWASRSDQTSRIPEAIALAEAEFNRRLRTRDMETKATFSITGEYVAVPADFLEVRSFYLNTTPKTDLEFMADDVQTNLFGESTGKPKYYSVVGSNFRFGPVPDGTYSATLVYYSKIVGLATTSPNWLLTSNPDVYLYSSLVHLGTLLRNPEIVSGFAQIADAALKSLETTNNRGRWGGSSMAVRIG